MNVVYINGVAEVISDLEDGIEVARDVMGDDWYSVMDQYSKDLADEQVDLEVEVDNYKADYESAVEEKDRLLYDIQELVETAISEINGCRIAEKKKDNILDLLLEAKDICYKNR